MRRQVLTIVFTCITSVFYAQIHEIGGFLGGANFIGDIGSTNYIKPNTIAGGLVYKRNLNPRIAIRGNYNFIPIKGEDAASDNPFREQRGFNFTNTIHEFAAGIEFNFFDYNIRDPRTSFTPYILAQAAIYGYKSPDGIDINNKIITKNEFSYSIPVGVGIKGRLSDNMAFAFESTVRITFEDDLDYTTSNFNNTSLNLDFEGNGNDFYVFTGFSIVYTFGRPPCYANLED